jgi:hypothetical protein
MTKALTYIRVKNGRIIDQRSSEYKEAEKNLLSHDGLYRKTLEKVYDSRSLNQNAYYHAIVIPAYVEGYKDVTGEVITLDQAHDELKATFCHLDLFVKHPQRDDRLTTTLGTTVEFNEYVEHCRRYISENLYIETPDPNE